MQKMIGYMRKAVQDYQMLQDGDRVAVGVSGGKDSLVTLLGLARLRQFLGVDFSLTAVTVDPGFGGKPGNYGEIRALCEENGIPYLVKQTQIGPIIFDIRKESNPCALCAKMRRGSLHDAAKEAGCNKLALGHNYDDAVETFVMNLFNEGRIGCFSPVTYLSRKDITVLRPLIYAPELEVRAAARRLELPVVSSACPADKNTNRQQIKEWLSAMEREHKGIKQRLFGAFCRYGVDGWREPGSYQKELLLRRLAGPRQGTEEPAD